jgi:hypothetical protein
VVRRLVHQQNVRLAKEHAGHGNAHLPPARERSDITVYPLVVEAEPVENFARAAFERITTEVFVFFLHDTETIERRSQGVRLRGIRHRMLEILELVMERAEAAAPGNGLIEHGSARHLFDVLTEVTDRHLTRHRHVAVIRTLFANDHPEQCCFAGAIRSDKAHFFAFVQLE